MVKSCYINPPFLAGFHPSPLLITMLLYHVLHNAHNSVRVQYAAQGLEPEYNWAQRKTMQWVQWAQSWKWTIKETDNWNSETLNGSGAEILVTQSRWAPIPHTHTQTAHPQERRNNCTDDRSGNNKPRNNYTGTPASTGGRENKGNRVGQSLDPDNTLGKLRHSLQWQQAQER